MGRMHSDAQFAGSSSVKPYGLFLLRTSAIKTSFIALGLSSVPAHVEMMGFLGIGNNPMVGCTVACAVGPGVPAVSMFYEHLADADDAALKRLRFALTATPLLFYPQSASQTAPRGMPPLLGNVGRPRCGDMAGFIIFRNGNRGQGGDGLGGGSRGTGNQCGDITFL